MCSNITCVRVGNDSWFVVYIVPELLDLSVNGMKLLSTGGIAHVCRC